MSKYMELLQAYHERVADLRALDSDLRLKSENFAQGLKAYLQIPDQIPINESGHTVNALVFGKMGQDGRFMACNRAELPAPRDGEIQFAIILGFFADRNKWVFEEEISISKPKGNYVLQFLTSSVPCHLSDEAGHVDFTPAYEKIYDLIKARISS